MSISILGIKLDQLDLKQAKNKVREFVDSNRLNLIVTPNPEFLLAARESQDFKKILNSADLSLPDGTGLVLAAHYLGLPKINRISGCDFVWELASYASQNSWSLYILGGERGVARKAAQSLLVQYPELKINGATSGYNKQNQMKGDQELADLINHARPDILLVAFGAPKQELWIARNRDKLHSVKVAMGVGGAFDYLAGRVRRAPKLIRKLGLEWLFRLIIQPSRIKRIYNAVIKFPIVVIFNKHH